MNGIAELKKNRGENFSIKQLEKSKKTVKQKLDKLNDQTRKDDVVTFEELGVDRLFIDEALIICFLLQTTDESWHLTSV